MWQKTLEKDNYVYSRLLQSIYLLTYRLSVLESRIKLALRLGWVLAEVYGRMTQPNIRWQTMFSKPSVYPVSRLFLSTRQPNNGEALYVDLQLLIYLVEKLYPPVNNSSEYKLYNDSRLPKSISDFVEQINAKMLNHENAKMLNHENDSVVPSSNTFHDLNHWSKQIWAVMSAEDTRLADAATLGAGLADTYWQWRLQKNNPKKEQKWEKLLSRERMLMMIKRLRQVEDYLPGHTGATLRHSIWEWSRSVSIIRKNTDYKFDQNNEEEIKNNLKKQLDIWEDLIFDRPIEYYLRYRDVLFIRVSTFISYIIIVFSCTVIVCLVVYSLFLILNFSLSYYESLIQKLFNGINSFENQIKLATSLIAVFAFISSQFTKTYKLASQLYSNIYEWFLLQKLIQRTFYSWNGNSKLIYKVIWKQIWVGNK
jgi:hypothetical protein